MTTTSISFPTYILDTIGDYKTLNSLKDVVCPPWQIMVT